RGPVILSILLRFWWMRENATGQLPVPCEVHRTRCAQESNVSGWQRGLPRFAAFLLWRYLITRLGRTGSCSTPTAGWFRIPLQNNWLTLLFPRQRMLGSIFRTSLV